MAKKRSSSSSAKAASRLKAMFAQGAWKQSSPKASARRRKGAAYKRGHEARFSVGSRAELAELRRLLAAMDIKPGKPFKKVNTMVVPVYGKEAVTKLNRVLGSKRAPNRKKKKR